MDRQGRGAVATRRYRPALFFLAAFIATWIPWFIAAYLASQGVSETYSLLLNFVGLLGPAVVAIILVLTSGDAALKADFKDRLVNLRRIRPIYLIAAIAIPSAVVVLSIWLSLWLGQSADQFALAGSGAALLPMIILTMVLAPIIEETGWHGYGVDSLRAYNGMLTATLLFGVLWSVWHTPLILINGSYPNQLASMDNPVFLVNFFVSVIPAAIIANWLYYKHRRSIVAAILFHTFLNAGAVLFSAGQVTKCIATVLYAVVAAAIIVADRTAFSNGPRDFVDDAVSGGTHPGPANDFPAEDVGVARRP